jgi:hypothetical protein
VITGERLVLSTKRYQSRLFRDFFDLDPSYRSIDTSSAVLDSARFPVISPASRLVTSAPDSLGGWAAAKLLNEENHHRKSPDLAAGSQLRADYLSPSPRAADYLVDGGYFENSGAETLLELVPKIQSLLPPGATLHAIVIHNAPVLPGDLACTRLPQGYEAQEIEFPADGRPGVTEVMPVTVTDDVRPFASNVISGDGIVPPADAFFNVREARGRLAVKQLSQLLGCKHVDESYFLDQPFYPSPPLTWFMDEAMHSRLKSSSERLLEEMKDSSPSLWDAISGADKKILCQEGHISQCK